METGNPGNSILQKSHLKYREYWIKLYNEGWDKGSFVWKQLVFRLLLD